MKIQTPLRWMLTLTLLVLAMTLSACVGGDVRNPSGWPGMTIHEGSVYVANQDAVYSLNLETGIERWRYPQEAERGRLFFAPPAVDSEQGLVIAGDFSQQVVALNQETGDQVWTSNTLGGMIIGGPVITGDLVLVPAADKNLYALRLSDGQVQWTFTTGDPNWASPLVVEDTIYLSSLDHHLYALDRSSGRQLWKVDVGGAIPDSPAWVEGVLLVGTFSDQLVAVEAETGRILWEFSVSNWVWGHPVGTQELIYFGDLDGNFYTVNLGSGTEQGSEQLSGAVVASPALDSSMLVITTGDIDEGTGTVLARDPTNNSPLWNQSLVGLLYSDPQIVDGKVVVAAKNGENLVTAYNAESGAVLWTYSPSSE